MEREMIRSMAMLDTRLPYPESGAIPYSCAWSSFFPAGIGV